jgi:hypothetical protein
MMQANWVLFMGPSRSLKPVWQVFEPVERLLATATPTSPIQQLLLFVAGPFRQGAQSWLERRGKKSGKMCKLYAIYLPVPTARPAFVTVCRHGVALAGRTGQRRR